MAASSPLLNPSVQLIVDSLLCVQLSQNGDARTQYSIESREDGFSAMTTANRLFYPLEVGATYGVEVR